MIRRAPLACLLVALAAPAAGQQQSDSYKFLQAVRDAKGDEVTQMIERPGSRIIDTRDPGSGEGALGIVVKRGDVTYLRYLLGHGADPNLRDDKGVTPLMLAVTLGQEGMIRYLLDAGANPNLANASGETPLIRAVQRRDLQMTRELVAGGANPDQADRMAGLSARDYARRDTRTPALLKLLDEKPVQTKAAVAGPKL